MEEDDGSSKVRLKDIKSFGLCYWLITINSMFAYAGINLFYNISNHFLRTSYNFTSIQAGRINSATYFSAALIIPFLGIFFDRVGLKALMFIISSALLFNMHIIILAIGECNRCAWGYLPMGFQCLAYSIYTTVVWPMFNNVVDPKLLGTAYGLNYVIENFGLAIGPSLIGYI